MKRYYVFRYESYSPSGGISDLAHQTDDLDQAMRVIDDIGDDEWVDIHDNHEGKLIASVRGERRVVIDKEWHVKDYEEVDFTEKGE